jgi:transposase-like protein
MGKTQTPTWTPRRSTRQSPWTAVEAEQALAAAAGAGLTLHSYARQHGLREQVLYNWQKRLAWQAPMGPASPALAFVTVVSAPPCAERRDTGLELAVGDVTVRVAVDFCTVTLARLLPVLFEVQSC